MELFRVTLCLSLLLACSLAGGPPAISFDKGDSDAIEVEAGAKSVELVFLQNHGDFPTYDMVEFRHQNPITSTERLLGKVNGQTPEEVATGYNISLVRGQRLTTITLTIETVSAQDDGVFMFKISSSEVQYVYEITKNVTVLQKLSEVNLQFHEEDPISTRPDDPIEVEAGSYPVKCLAEGSNPPTMDVKLHLDGNPVTLEGEPQTELMAGDTRKYRTTIMGTVTLPYRKATLELECVASDISGHTLSTKLDIKVVALEVEDVQCQQTRAEKGESSVTLVCTVDHANLNVSKYAYEIGKTGEIIEPGSGEANKTTVSVMTMSATKTRVTLTLPKAEDWHFESDFYLLIYLADGQVRKKTLTLKESDDKDDTGYCPTSPIGWILFFLAVAISWNRH